MDSICLINYINKIFCINLPLLYLLVVIKLGIPVPVPSEDDVSRMGSSPGPELVDGRGYGMSPRVEEVTR